MDKDLIKALRCLASQDCYGNCYADRRRWGENGRKMYCGSPIGEETEQCPYHQDKYPVCFTDGECGEWLNEIGDILEKYEELRHFFEVEIGLAKGNKEEECNRMFNGVEVGIKEQIELNKGHIRFCKQVLKMMDISTKVGAKTEL